MTLTFYDPWNLSSTFNSTKSGSFPSSTRNKLESVTHPYVKTNEVISNTTRPSYAPIPISFTQVKKQQPSTHGLVLISAPAGATPITLQTPQPL